MGIISGYICLVLLIVLMAKYVTKRAGNAYLNKIFQKMHVTVAIIFVIVTIVHLLFVLPVLKTRAATVTGFGIVSMIFAITLTVVSLYMKKKGKMALKFHHAISLFLLIGLVGHIVFYYVDFLEYKTAIADIKIEDVNISNLKEGIYVGEYDAGYIYAKVQVKIRNGKIENVDLLKHDNERGAKAEQITSEIVNQQKVNVDAVTSATNSSKVIKKAVENALVSGDVR